MWSIAGLRASAVNGEDRTPKFTFLVPGDTLVLLLLGSFLIGTVIGATMMVWLG